MYVIIIYDVGEERVGKVCKYLRRFLTWVQNSAFEGEVTESKLARIKSGLEKLIDKGEDSVLFYTGEPKWIKRDCMGMEKGLLDNVL